MNGFYWAKSRWARVFLAIFVLLAIGFLILFITAPKPKEFRVVIAGQEYTDKEKAKERLAQELEKDSDQDGLKDWEEIIYRTDAKNPDTDGDGTPDGQEIKEGRDPTKKGPNDKLLSVPDALKAIAPSITPDKNFTYDSRNLTQNFSKKLLESNLLNDLLKTKDKTTFSQNLEQFIAQSNILSDQPPQHSYPLDRVRLRFTETQTPEAVKQYLAAYGNLFANAIQQNQWKLDDATVINNFLKNDVNELEKLDIIMSGYKELLEKSYDVPLPKNILWFHQNMFTFLSRTISELEILRALDTDPLKAASIVPEWAQTKLLFLLNNALLKEWLTKQNIVYGTAEVKPLFLLGK